MWRGVALGASLGVALCGVFTLVGWNHTAYGQAGAETLTGDLNVPLVVRTWDVPAGQMVLVVEPERRVMGSYFVADNGMIQLKSVRRFEWDFRMEQFNASDPMPQQVRDMVEQP